MEIENIFRINGKDFTDVNEAKAYKEDLDKKENEKAEKSKQEQELRRIVDHNLDALNQSIKNYQEKTGVRVIVFNKNDNNLGIRYNLHKPYTLEDILGMTW